MNMSAKQNQCTISALFKKSQDSQSMEENAAKAELLLVAFMAEHHTPFSPSGHLIETIKAAFPDSAIAKKVTLNKTKASYVMQHGVAWQEKVDLKKILQTQKFSLLIDESTDIAIQQVLAVVVRYFDEHAAKTVDSLLDVVEIGDASGQGLYNAVKKLMGERNIPLANIIGFASDNCATMTGSKSGFQMNLKQDVPSVFMLGCIWHCKLRMQSTAFLARNVC